MLHNEETIQNQTELGLVLCVVSLKVTSRACVLLYRCCHKHDCCYGDAEFAGCQTKTDRYQWTCDDKQADCGMMCCLDLKHHIYILLHCKNYMINKL